LKVFIWVEKCHQVENFKRKLYNESMEPENFTRLLEIPYAIGNSQKKM